MTQIADLVKLLLDYGADKNALDSRKRTPLDVAADCGLSVMVELLQAAETETQKVTPIGTRTRSRL